jgi:hypothetical protein
MTTKTGEPGSLLGSRVVLVAVLLAFALSGCGKSAVAFPPAGPTSQRALSPSPFATPVNLGISNGTTLAVTLFVNGERVASYPSGGPPPSMDPASLPGLPWTVEVRSPSGRVLTSMQVKPGDVQTTTVPGGGVEHSAPFARVDLSCGRLTIWAGDMEPSGPVPEPSSGTPGDCTP